MLQLFKDLNLRFNFNFNINLLHKKERTNLLCLDIGSSSVKVIELGEKTGKVCLVKYAVLPLPEDCIEAHQVKSYSALTEVLTKFVKDNGYKNHDTAIILSGPQVVTQLIKVPAEFADHQLHTHIELEAEKTIPFELDELSMDFDVVDADGENKEYIEVLLAAAKKDYVNEFIDIMKAVGLNLRIIDVYSCVMARLSMHVAVKQMGWTNSINKVIALIDIGHDILTVTVFKNERQLYLKEQNFGGRELNNVIREEHSVDYAQAEKLKLHYSDPNISNLIDNFRDQLSMQIYQMLQFFYASAFANKIDHVFLLGGGAVLKDLEMALEEKINLPVKKLDIFVDINTSNFSTDQKFSDCYLELGQVCGLALRSHIQ